MANDSSFAELIDQLRAGIPDAARDVYERFARRLIALASTRLNGIVRQKTDPESVVQSVFLSFFTRQREGRLQLDSWEGLWDLLVLFTLRKCSSRAEHWYAAIRDVRRELPPSSNDANSDTSFQPPGREPTPAEAAELADTVEQLLGHFAERERAILELRLQGCSTEEVSERVGCSERKVYRVQEQAREEFQRLLTTEARNAGGQP